MEGGFTSKKQISNKSNSVSTFFQSDSINNCGEETKEKLSLFWKNSFENDLKLTDQQRKKEEVSLLSLREKG